MSNPSHVKDFESVQRYTFLLKSVQCFLTSQKNGCQRSLHLSHDDTIIGMLLFIEFYLAYSGHIETSSNPVEKTTQSSEY